MSRKCIGIVGGAGPLAGAFLLKRLIDLSSSQYGCYRDADFPQINLISFPFSEMLIEEKNDYQLRQELSYCLKQLRDNGADVLGIACNTLHAFLEGEDGLIHMPRETALAIPAITIPLVFCTSTSLQFQLHNQCFPCIYPDSQTQLEVDQIIDTILKGYDDNVIIHRLSELINRQNTPVIVLGCTELSLFTERLIIKEKVIIDPLEILAHKLLKEAFCNVHY